MALRRWRWCKCMACSVHFSLLHRQSPLLSCLACPDRPGDVVGAGIHLTRNEIFFT